MLRYLRTLGCPHPVAEEIAQEAFLRLHAGLQDGASVRTVRAWMFRVARNLWIDQQRQAQRYWSPGEDEDDHLDLRQAASEPDQERRVLGQERTRLIANELQRLPERQRACLQLKAQGLKYHEIAAALGISMSTAVDSVRKAIEKLRLRLGE